MSPPGNHMPLSPLHAGLTHRHWGKTRAAGTRSPSVWREPIRTWPVGRGDVWEGRDHVSSMRWLSRVRHNLWVLLNASTDSHWFHHIALPYAAKIDVIEGRLKCGGARYHARFAHVVVIFKPGEEADIRARIRDIDLCGGRSSWERL
jgi:hypothetical protein